MVQKLKKIKLIGFDFDGVFTDAKVLLNQDGVETVICSRRDGLGINELKRLGIKLVVVSKERNPVVSKRCEKLKIECAQGIDDKLSIFKQTLKKQGLNPQQAAFMGDDFNDLDCMIYGGVAFTVADAHPDCKKIAHYITKRKGGDHAVKEVCDLIISIKSQSR
mgnify:FL=1